MPLTTLLSPETAPLRTMTVSRLQLEQAASFCTLAATGEEILLYPLVGHIRVQHGAQCLGVIGGRQSVTHRGVECLRLPREDGMSVQLILQSYAADLLIVSTLQPGPATAGCIHQGDVAYHEVGEGTHRREVREVPTPLGYRLHAGETLNIPGGWSSWPSHATPEETVRYAEHEECFFVISPGYGLMHTNGIYPTGQTTQDILKIGNGDAVVTPLGSHEIVFAPGAWGWYAWFYMSFLQKTYNRWADEGVKTYVK